MACPPSSNRASSASVEGLIQSRQNLIQQVQALTPPPEATSLVSELIDALQGSITVDQDILDGRGSDCLQDTDAVNAAKYDFLTQYNELRSQAGLPTLRIPPIDHPSF